MIYNPGGSTSSVLTSVLAILTGGIGAIVSIFFVTPMRERQKIWLLSQGLEIGNFDPARKTAHRIQVRNGGTEAIGEAIGYLDLDNDPRTDNVTLLREPNDPNTQRSYEGAGYWSSIRNGRLCWAIGGNPHKLDIYPGEPQLLNFAQIFTDSTHGNLIAIASENGLGEATDSKRIARAFLKLKKYQGTLRIVGKNMLPRDFAVTLEIDGDKFGNIPVPEVRPRKYGCYDKWRFILCNKFPTA